MSVYVGIDVHRKRSQVAVVIESGEVLANRNVPNGTEPILSVIGGLPLGTPAAFEAAFGTGWLVELLEDYGFAPHLVHSLRCKAIASAQLKNDKVDAAILAQLLRADLLPEAWIAPPPVRQLRALCVATSQHRGKDIQMNTYLLVYRHPENYIGTADTAAAWKTWFKQLGSHLVDPGNPVFERTPVGTCGTPLPLDGYTLVTASDFAEAVELAKGCPIIKEGGGVEVGLLTPVPGREHPARIF